ncbi:MAG: hypothetical protein ACYS9Y_11060 [Planctomycetota bacterium]|jgi:hypothetical protein
MATRVRILIFGFAVSLMLTGISRLNASERVSKENPDMSLPVNIADAFGPPAEYKNNYGSYTSPLLFRDGTKAQTAEEWKRRREEILRDTKILGRESRCMACFAQKAGHRRTQGN